MIRSPLGLRLDPSRSVREQFAEAARLGAKGVVIDAVGEISPENLSETGRREIRHLLRAVELKLIAVLLPTRRPFDTLERLEDRLGRADRAFALAYELGANQVLAKVGGVPEEADALRRGVFTEALRELAKRAEHRGVRLALETGEESGDVLRSFLELIGFPSLSASIDPASLLERGIDPVSVTVSLKEWVSHVYATDPARRIGSRYAIARNSGRSLEWEEFLGALEEIGYSGFLTVRPESSESVAAEFQAVADRARRF